jgi:hypothetical protein
MTDRFTHDAAPYVLGALAPEERRAFEAHVAGCAACTAEVRDFAGLPGLLSRLPADEVLSEPEDQPEPPSLLGVLLRRARAERRTRRWRVVLVTAAAAGLAAVGSAVVTDVAERPPAQQVAAVPFVRTEERIPVSAEATLTDVPGGTRIDMTCRYTGDFDGRQREYVLRVVPRYGGEPQQLGSWPVLSTDDYRVAVVAPLPRSQIGSLEVTNATSRVLLVLRL